MVRILLLTAFVISSPVLAQQCETIDFETIPGGAPSDGLTIDSQFLETLGVTFSLENGGAPVLAEVGAPQTAFEGFGGLPDNPAPDQNAGSFFLTDDGKLTQSASNIIVTFDVPVSEARGEILDIDGGEQFVIEARDEMGQMFDSVIIMSGDAGTGDGIATSWSISQPGADIHSLLFMGSRTGCCFGLAFDNFDACTIPVGTEDERPRDVEFTLSAAHPNPFGKATALVLDLDTPQAVTVAVFDALGRRVAMLHEGTLSAGTHTLNFEADDLPSGMYVIRAQNADGRQIRTVTLLR
jgi:hypothetical protein